MKTLTVNRETLRRALSTSVDGMSDAIAARSELAAVLAQPAEAEGVEDVQVMARVHHNDEHAEPVRAVLNSIGRQMEDDAKLMAVAQHERIVSAVTAERDQLRAKVEAMRAMAQRASTLLRQIADSGYDDDSIDALTCWLEEHPGAKLFARVSAMAAKEA